MKLSSLSIAVPNTSLMLKVAGLAVAYFVTGRAAIGLAEATGGIVLLWPSNAIVLAVLLRHPIGTWPYFLLASFFAVLATGAVVVDTLAFGVGYALCDVLDILLAGLALRWLCGVPLKLDKLQDLLIFVVTAAVLAPMAGSFFAGYLQMTAYGDPYWQGWVSWWISSAVGMLIVTPLCLELGREQFAEWRAAVVPGEAAALVVVAAGFTAFLFWQDRFFLMFLIMPFLLWGALRAGRLGVATLNIVIMVASVYHTVEGHGPIAMLYPDSVESQILFLQSAGLTERIAALLGERKSGDRDLASTGEEVRRLIIEAEMPGDLVAAISAAYSNCTGI